jgi:hypothetical protein
MPNDSTRVVRDRERDRWTVRPFSTEHLNRKKVSGIAIAPITLGIMRRSHEKPLSVSLMWVVISLSCGVATAFAAAPTPTPTPPSNEHPETPSVFDLDLDTVVPEVGAATESPRFRLDVERIPPTSEPKPAEPDGRHLTLSTDIDEESRQKFFADAFDTLAEDRWPDGLGRLEYQIMSEQWRVVEGGLLGFPGGSALMFDVMAVTRLAKQAWKALSGSSHNTIDESVVLRVSNRVGVAPGIIAVLPMVGSTVGELFTVGCDSLGRCILPEGIETRSTLLVVEDGAALVQLSDSPGESLVLLTAVGLLRLQPSDGMFGLRARIVDADRSAVLPVARWLNSSGDEWVAIPRWGLSMQLPEGRYFIETKTPTGTERTIETTVTARATTVEKLP